MLINFDPTVTGGLVYKTMRDDHVSAKLQECGVFIEEDQHNLVKAILIAGFRDLEVDVNKLISAAKYKALATQEQ